VDTYRSAIPLLRWLKIEDGMIDVLKNLAFALAESGDVVEAQRLIDDAMESAGRHGTYFMEGLCLNTKSLVAIRAGQLEQAVKPARDALALFREIGNLRGEGLACSALAEAYRRLALEHRGDGERQRAEIQEAMGWGEQAVQIFRDKVPEPVRHVDALIEAGSACRDRIRIERETFKVPADWLKRGAEEVDKGRRYLERAAKLAEEQLPARAVDAWVNLAMLSLLLEDYEECATWLSQAESFVPDRYRIEAGKPYPPPGGETPGFWLSLGKLYQVRMQSLWYRRKEAPSGEDIEQICEWMVLSMAYDELFYPTSFGARRGQDDLYSGIKAFPIDLLQWVYRSVWKYARKYGLPRSKEVPQGRTMAIKFLERHFGPSNEYVREEELAEFWT
jgi:tetratricopeptide (TPR) repeat protein